MIDFKKQFMCICFVAQGRKNSWLRPCLQIQTNQLYLKKKQPPSPRT